MSRSRPFVSVAELALATGYSRMTVVRHIKSGNIPAARLSTRGAYHIPLKEAEKILDRLGLKEDSQES